MSYELGLHRIHLAETDSTNRYAREHTTDAAFTLITTEHQTAGRGQRGNTWESAPGENLLFSLAFRPTHIPSAQQFVLCELISVALCEVLSTYTEDIRIKWPNDIYHRDRKLCGILIEHDLEGTHLSRTIIGVGLNVNQCHFASDAPNPVSLLHVLGHEVEREALLSAIVSHFVELYRGYATSLLSRDSLHRRYTALLYRKDVPASYADSQGAFTAILRDVAPDGRLLLEDRQGTLRSYLFKEVVYII